MVCKKPMRMKVEAIQRLKPPTMPKGCRSLARVVIFLSSFCPELQKLLKPLYDLMRKEEYFIEKMNNKRLLSKLKKDSYKIL